MKNKEFLIGDMDNHHVSVDLSEIVAIDSGQRLYRPDGSEECWLVDYVDVTLKNGSIIVIYQDDAHSSICKNELVDFITNKSSNVCRLSDILDEKENKNGSN